MLAAQRVVTIRPSIGVNAHHGAARPGCAMVVGRMLGRAIWSDLTQRFRERRIEMLVQGNRDRVKATSMSSVTA
jgi:hypothetical protein